MRNLATAIAFVLVAAGAAAFVGTPAVTQDDQSLHASAASSSDCPSNTDFTIEESHLLADSRDLAGNTEEIGLADVVSGTPEDLMVDLETSNDQLDVEVFYDPDGEVECAEFDGTSCDESVDQTGHEQICQLDADKDRDYWVHFTNPQGDKLTYHTWTPDA